MGTSDLYHVLKLLCLGRNGVANLFHRRNQRVLHAFCCGNVHRRRKCVVRGLGHVDVVIGVDRLFRSHLSACHLNRTVGDDLVDIHVGLRAAAGLPDAQRKLIIEFAVNDFIGSLHDQVGLVRRKLAQILVHQGARLFKKPERTDQLGRHGVASDIKVQQRALRLSSPIDVCRDFDLPHAVGLDASANRLFQRGCHGLPERSGIKCRENYSNGGCPTTVISL